MQIKMFFFPVRSPLLLIFLLIVFVYTAGCSKKSVLNANNIDTPEKLICIRTIDLTEDRAHVQIQADGPLKYAVTEQSDPLGLVLYLPHTCMNQPVILEAAGTGPVVRVLANVRPPATRTTRVEIQLAREIPYQISADDATLHIRFDVSDAKNASPPSIRTVEKLNNNAAPLPENANSVYNAPQLLDIQVEATAKTVELTIVTDGLLGDYNSFALVNPPRIVFDLPPVTEVYKAERVIFLNTDIVSRIRHYGTSEKLRIVLDTYLNYLDQYEARLLDKGLLIRVGAVAAAPVAATVRQPEPTTILPTTTPEMNYATATPDDKLDEVAEPESPADPIVTVEPEGGQHFEPHLHEAYLDSTIPLSQAQYKLGPGDVLEISVWNDEALYREVRIRPDGQISFPLIGDVAAYGRTVSELKAKLEARMDEYIPGVPVTVILRSLGYPRIHVVGKVAQPGPFMMDTELTVIQALAMAGGLTPFASRSKILIIRRQNEEQTILEFNYGEIERGRNLEQNIILLPGDTVIVP